MTELSPEAAVLLESARLLEEARHNHGPSETDRARVLQSLHVSLGIGIPVTLGAAAATAAASQGAASSALQGGASVVATSGSASVAPAAASLATGATAQSGLGLASKLLTWKVGKLLLASAALGSAVGIGALAVPRSVSDAPAELSDKAGQATAFAAALADAGSASPVLEPRADHGDTTVAQRAAAPTITAAALDERAALPTTGLRDEPLATGRAPAQGRLASHRVHRRAKVRASTASATKDAPASVPSPEPAAVSAAALQPAPVEPPGELSLIRKAMTSLRDRDAVRALSLLDEHAARYPAGSFGTERRGLRVVALCAAGKLAEGQREQAAFLKSAGGSPIAARVRGACAERDD